MFLDEYRTFCLSLPSVSEGFPFDADTLVFKIGGKMFSLTNVESFKSVNLKCDPEKAIQLREEYSEVKPGYHMSKKHWNTVSTDSLISDELIYQWTKDSYELVVKSLTKKLRKELGL